MNATRPDTTVSKQNYDVSVIIPVFNRAAYTLRCLETLAENSGPCHYEVIIVDNGSSDQTPALLSSLSGDVTVIRNENNLGFARACNQGARAAGSEMLLFLNNDTEPQPGWLEPMLDVLAGDERAAIVGSKLVYPRIGRIQHAGVVFRPTGAPYHVFQGVKADHFAVNSMERFQAVTGACLLIRAEVFFAVGMFDEQYVNGYEDIDLCLKVGRLGRSIHYTPRSLVLHHESISPARKARDLENLLLFITRWGGQVVPDENRYYAKLGVRLDYSPDGRLCTVHHFHAPEKDRTFKINDGELIMDVASMIKV